MHFCRAVHWGPEVNRGSHGARLIHLSAISKCASTRDPYTVANEVAAAQLGRFLCLPVAPGCIVTDDDGKVSYASLDFNLTGEVLQPVIPADFASTFGQEAVAGLIAFDAFICNADRHASNLWANYTQRLYHAFDHSHSLLSGSHHGVIGVKQLDVFETQIGFQLRDGTYRHCLRTQLTDANAFSDVLGRIESIPDFFIADIADTLMLRCGISEAIAIRLSQFLIERKLSLRTLLNTNKSAFPNVVTWGRS